MSQNAHREKGRSHLPEKSIVIVRQVPERRRKAAPRHSIPLREQGGPHPLRRFMAARGPLTAA